MFREFLDIEQATLRSNLNAAPDIVAIFQMIARFYHRILEGVRDTSTASVEERLILILLFHQTYKFWLNGAAVLLRGHLNEFLPMMRGALESAAYAHKIRLQPELAEVWLQREERNREFDAAFRDGGIERQLFPENDVFVRRLWSLFDIASRFGVHSNRERLAFSLDITEGPNGHPRIDLIFGSNDLQMIRKCAGFCATAAYRMLEVFRPCFEDITGLAVWTTEWAEVQGHVLAFIESAQGAPEANQG